MGISETANAQNTFKFRIIVKAGKLEAEDVLSLTKIPVKKLSEPQRGKIFVIFQYRKKYEKTTVKEIKEFLQNQQMLEIAQEYAETNNLKL